MVEAFEVRGLRLVVSADAAVFSQLPWGSDSFRVFLLLFTKGSSLSKPFAYASARSTATWIDAIGAGSEQLHDDIDTIFVADRVSGPEARELEDGEFQETTWDEQTRSIDQMVNSMTESIVRANATHVPDETNILVCLIGRNASVAAFTSRLRASLESATWLF